jgi:PAS domain S-box-containing protein
MPNRSELTEAFRQAALAVSTAEGGHVFEQLVTALARILGVEFAMISVYVEPRRTHLRTLATFFDGRLARNIEYAIAGTPCEQAIGRTFGFYPKGVTRRFPGDGVLSDHDIEAYAATTLHDLDGAPIGALTVMSRREIKDAALTEAMLNIFAARVSAEIGRRYSEASYRAVFESAETAIFLHDIDSNAIVDVNPKACAVYGYSADELKRLSLDELSAGIPPYTGTEARRHFERAREGEVVRGEWRRRNKDGSLHWDEVTLKRVEIAGRPHILAATREITERKAAEDALRASEEQYRAIFNATTDSLTLRDADFRIVDVNATYERMSGLKREDVIGMTELTVDVLEVKDWRRDVHERVLKGEAMRIESDARRRDGSLFRVEVMVLPMQYRGAPHALLVARDITARKRADEALRASEEQYRAIFNAMADGLTLRDADFRVVEANPAYARMTGYPLEEVIGSDNVTTLSLKDRDFARQLHARALAGEPVQLEGKARRKDGALIDCEVFGVPMSYRGAPHVLYIGRDITDRKAAEGALRASEEQYREIFNATADALVLRDAHFRIVDVNAAYEAMSGKRRGEVIGLTELTLTRGAAPIDRRALHAEALRGRPISFEADGRREDGSPFVLEVRGVPMTYRGEPHVLYIGRDVTVAKAAERDLRESEEQYRAIFNASFDGMIIRTLEGEIVDVNPALLAMYGYQRKDLIGRDFGPIISGARIEGFREYLATIKAGRPYRTESRVPRKDGSAVYIEVLGSPVTYRGKPHALSVVRDITERRAREARLRATVAGALDCIIVMDSEGAIREFNPAAEACFGYAREEVLGKLLADMLIPDRFRDRHQQGMLRYLETGEGPFLGKRVEVVARRKDGTEFPGELAIAVAKEPGGQFFVGYLRDLTERRRADAERSQLEVQLRQAQKMEAIGQLTGGIAHDFNNILQGVLGNLVLAEERQADLADPKLARYLDRAHTATQRARDLIQQMLTFSRGKSGERRPATAGALIEDATRLLRPTLPATIELVTDVEPALPGALLDTVQFEQVLLNLCINARDAMQGTGRLALAARVATREGAYCASCRQRIDGTFLEIAVGDSGPGIASDVRERMFDPFFSTKEVGKGSGMGLAMVHGIVHQHGGHVLVESAPGAGTTFRVLIPPAASPAQAPAAVRPGPARREREALSGRVLVADDEDAIRELLGELLEDWGLDVVLCPDGAEARDAFADDPQGFDLVLTDQTMPRLTGMQLAKLVTRMQPGVPVLLCTGYGEDLKPADLKAAGVRTLVHKPVEPAELRRLLQAALQTRNKAPT